MLLLSYIPVLSKERDDPWRDGGLEPARLAGRELGLDPLREPPGVSPRLGVYDGFLGT